MSACGTCGTEENWPADRKSELRPYGPGGTNICVRCAHATPEARAQVEDAMRVQLEAATIMGDGVATLTDHGFEPGAPE